MGGTISLTGPEYEDQFAIEGTSATTSFLLSETLPSGTYYITYIFESANPESSDAIGEYSYDVDGYIARILGCELDKTWYAKEDMIHQQIYVDTTHPFDGRIYGMDI